jgi:hypothetical protein
VRRVEDGVVTVASNGMETTLPVKAPDCFDVGRFRQIEVAAGDKLLVRANRKRAGLINGQVLTVDRIEGDGTIMTREGVQIPSGFCQWCHGYVVTSHKSQGRTHKHVIVAAEWLDAKSAYVACSRGKISCAIHTPDKAALLERLPEGTRRAALDVLAESANQRRDSLAMRMEVWLKLLPVVVKQAVKTVKKGLRQSVDELERHIRTQKQRHRIGHEHREIPQQRHEIAQQHRVLHQQTQSRGYRI